MNDEIEFYYDEISIRSILRDFLNNWWLFLLSAVTAILLLSSYENLVYKEHFTSSATMVVSAKGKGTTDALADLTMTTGMAQVFSDIFSSDVLRELVAKELNVETDTFAVQANIIPETNLLIVQVSGTDPKIVHQAISSVLTHCTEVSEYVFSNAVLDVLQQPTVVRSTSSAFASGKSRRLLVLVSVVLMAAIIGTLSILRETVKTEVAARRRITGEKLTIIGHEEKNRTLKAKLKSMTKAILITNPTTSFGYVESIKKLSFRIHSDMKVKNQKILLVTSIGENEGKSTVASNIAIALAQSGKNVILADLDLRRPAIHKIFEVPNNKQHGFWKETYWLNGNHRLELILNSKPVRKTVQYLKKTGAGDFLNEARQQADYIIIDSSPVNVAADTELILAYADAVLLVIRQDWSYISEINRFIDVLSQNNVDFIGYVLNDFKSQNPLEREPYDYGYGKSYETYRYGEYNR